MQKFRRYFPKPEELRKSRWLSWAGPTLQHPRLWHFSRRGVALGLALGIFFGLLIPMAQIPVSAAVAVVLRANVPGAVASTLVTNPLTFGPIYYGAWRLGKALLNEPVTAQEERTMAEEPLPAATAQEQVQQSWFGNALARIKAVGKPLLLGLLIFATVGAFCAYFLTLWLWSLFTVRKRRKRLRERAA
jgi:uncharacterized protein (DUF2062 family)